MIIVAFDLGSRETGCVVMIGGLVGPSAWKWQGQAGKLRLEAEAQSQSEPNTGAPGVL